MDVFSPSTFLIPKKSDLRKWSVIACDQYTAQPEYWKALESFIGAAPSTLHMILPEVYWKPEQESELLPKVIREINTTMQSYLDRNLFESHSGLVYIERTLHSGTVRAGLLGVVDLERYEYSQKSQAEIRSTEGTVLDRLPPRVEIRKEAPLELPHVMVLYDDPQGTVQSLLKEAKGSLPLLYDFDLYENGGHLRGVLTSAELEKKLLSAMNALRHNSPFLFAVGDGNHSLAAAKNCYERIKQTLPPDQAAVHPARFALVEAVNLHDASLRFEPIHRLVMETDPALLLQAAHEFDEAHSGSHTHEIPYIHGREQGVLVLRRSPYILPVAALQDFLDHYLKSHAGQVDYIHGDETIRSLAEQSRDRIGFMLPAIPKTGFFEAVAADGSFPRKTFSMGHAEDKRFYLESRRITG